MNTADKTPHIRELSSMRGIAAMLVLWRHALTAIERHSNGYANQVATGLIDRIAFLCNGQAMVETFFVLSGLVLSLSLARAMGRNSWISSFYIKRIFRIYPALWVSLVIALVFLKFERGCGLSGICTEIGAGDFQEKYTPSKIGLSFLGIYVHLNGPMWSLRTELFYSLLFPGIFLLQHNRKTRWPSLAVIFAFAVLPIPRLCSVHYALAFALGATIPYMQLSLRRLPYGLFALAALGVLIFTRRMLQWEDKTFEVIEMLASFVIVCIIYHRKINLPFLRHNIFFYLGEISYSFYLLHYPLLFTLFSVMVSVVGVETIHASPNAYTLVLGAATTGVTLALSTLVYMYVEKPFQSLGRHLLWRKD